jgi:hypothetical protein
MLILINKILFLTIWIFIFLLLIFDSISYFFGLILKLMTAIILVTLMVMIAISPMMMNDAKCFEQPLYD